MACKGILTPASFPISFAQNPPVFTRILHLIYPLDVCIPTTFLFSTSIFSTLQFSNILIPFFRAPFARAYKRMRNEHQITCVISLGFACPSSLKYTAPTTSSSIRTFKKYQPTRNIHQWPQIFGL